MFRALEEAEEEEEGEEHEEEEEAFGVVENTASETDGGSAAFSFIGDFGFVGLSTSVYNSDYGIPGGHGHEEGEEGEGEGEEEEEELVSISLEQQRQDLSARFDMQGLFEHLKIRAARSDYEHTEFEGDEVGTMFDTTGTDFRAELKHGAIANAEGAVGLQYKQIDFSAIGDEAFVPSSETTQLSLFAFEEFTLNDAVVLQASARLEWQDIEVDGANDYNEAAMGASLGALWGFTDAMTLAFNLAYTERHPNATELFADGPHIAVQRYERGSYTLGTGRLDKEISTNLDVTLRGRFDRHEFSATAFVNDIHDYIVLAPTALELDGLPVFDYRQTDARLSGLELEWLVELMETDTGHLHASLLFDFVNGEQSGGADLPRIPPMRVGAGLHFSNEAFDASIEAMRVSSQSDVALNELPTDGYTMIDAEASYRFENPNVMVFLRGTNLGDEDARRHTSPLKDIVPLPGRSLHLGLRWDF